MKTTGARGYSTTGGVDLSERSFTDDYTQNRSSGSGPRPMLKDLPSSLRSRSHFSSFIFLQTSLVCPVLESITVVTSRQLHVTVLAFSCLTTTQCSMSSAVGGGSWLRIGGGVAATGGFFAAQPTRSKQNTSQAFFMPFVFALSFPLVDGNLGYTPQP